MNIEYIVDSREKEVINQTIKLYPDTKVEALYAGDFTGRENNKFTVGIERKTLEDFVNSIQNKRIFKQIEKLHETYPVVIVILEGKMDDLRKKLHHLNLKFDEGIFWGTIASIVVRDNFQIFWSANTNETIHMARQIITKVAEGKYRTVRRWMPKSKNTPRDLLKQIPGVTDDVAKALLKKYISIQNIAMQTQQELCSIKGVGPSVVLRIKKFLC